MKALKIYYISQKWKKMEETEQPLIVYQQV
jgi:hypothetical protein